MKNISWTKQEQVEILKEVLETLVEVEEHINEAGDPLLSILVAKVLNARGTRAEDGLYQNIQERIEQLGGGEKSA